MTIATGIQVSDLVDLSAQQGGGNTATQEKPAQAAPQGMPQAAPQASAMPNLPAGFESIIRDTIREELDKAVPSQGAGQATNTNSQTTEQPRPPKPLPWKTIEEFKTQNAAELAEIRRLSVDQYNNYLKAAENQLNEQYKLELQFKENSAKQRIAQKGFDVSLLPSSVTPTNNASGAANGATSSPDAAAQKAAIETEIAKYPGLQSFYAGLNSEPLKDKLRNDFKSWQVTFEKMSKDTDYTNTYSHIQDLLQTGNPNMQTTIQDYVNEYETALTQGSTKQRYIEKKKLDARAAGKPASSVTNSSSPSGDSNNDLNNVGKFAGSTAVDIGLPVVGAAIGSLLGPAGTMAGAFIGGAAANLLNKQLFAEDKTFKTEDLLWATGQGAISAVGGNLIGKGWKFLTAGRAAVAKATEEAAEVSTKKIATEAAKELAEKTGVKVGSEATTETIEEAIKARLKSLGINGSRPVNATEIQEIENLKEVLERLKIFKPTEIAEKLGALVGSDPMAKAEVVSKLSRTVDRQYRLGQRWTPKQLWERAQGLIVDPNDQEKAIITQALNVLK